MRQCLLIPIRLLVVAAMTTLAGPVSWSAEGIAELPSALREFNEALLSMRACHLNISRLVAHYNSFKKNQARAVGLTPEMFDAAETQIRGAFVAKLMAGKNDFDCQALTALRTDLLATLDLLASGKPANVAHEGWLIKTTIPPDKMPAIRRFLVKGDGEKWTHTDIAEISDENVERVAINPYTKTIWLDARRSTSGNSPYACWYGAMSSVSHIGNDRKKAGLTVCNSNFVARSSGTESKISQGFLVRAFAGKGQRNVGGDALTAWLVEVGFFGRTHDRIDASVSYVPIPVLPQLAMGTVLRTAQIDALAVKDAVEESGLIEFLEDQNRRFPPSPDWAKVDTVYRVDLPDPHVLRPATTPYP